MPRYSLALRLPKPLQCLHCTLMPAFECDKSAKDVADAFDKMFERMDSILLLSKGEGPGPDCGVVDMVHLSRDLVTAHMKSFEIVTRTLCGQPVDPESAGICYQPFVRPMHRRCFGEGEEADARVVELLEIDPQTRTETLVRHWELVSAYADVLPY